MNINGISGAGAPQNTAGMAAGKSGQMDPESKNLQQQIEKLQNELKEISANQEMPTDMKMKKRQEIQKQISELQIQLRQHQIEVQREEREKKKEESSFDDLMGTKNPENQNGSISMSTDSMNAMVSADVSLKQANVQGHTIRKMEGRANVLETEIQLDKGRGGSSNIGQKEAELADIEKNTQNALASQMDSLTQAGETLEKAAEEEKPRNQTDDISSISGEKASAEQAAYGYHPIDIKL